MLYPNSIIGVIQLLILVVAGLLSVAYVTVVERKTMASMQRRLGPNIVGSYGLLQAFADALKLLLKEYVSPTQANLIIFFLGPVITLVFSLLSLAVIPFAAGISFSDLYLAILYLLAMSSLSTYGILLAGWSANSKYAFLGSLRSTAQLISYELVLSSLILIIVMLTSSLNFTVTVECQKAVWFIFPLSPVFYIFYIAAIAETNRAPFDLAEAESELVSGFMTEHSSVIFVFFFLAEYTSMLVICILITLIYLGGYDLDLTVVTNINDLIWDLYTQILIIFYYIFAVIFYTLKYLFLVINNGDYASIFSNNLGSYYAIEELPFLFIKNFSLYDYLSVEKTISAFYTNTQYESLFCSLMIGLKTFIMIFTFIWIRASYPRIRFDQLMTYCWTVLLPIVFAFLIIMPCLLYIIDMMPNNTLYF